jgi:hypothetical protein
MEELQNHFAEEMANFDKHLNFEHLISDLSARFVNISSERVDSKIERACPLMPKKWSFAHILADGLLSYSYPNPSRSKNSFV